MTHQRFKLAFPIWQFLNQPLFEAENPVILNPRHFWNHYKMRHLERCWQRMYRPEEHYRS